MQKIRFALQPTGAPAATMPAPPYPSFAPELAAEILRHREMAAAAAAKLYSVCEMPDVGDPREFLAGVIRIFSQYPVEVMDAVVDPAGLPSRVARPRLVDVRTACDDAYEPIERRRERERAGQGVLCLPAPPAGPKLTRAELEARWGRPIAPRCGSTCPPDADHVPRALADLAARKAAREGDAA